MLAVVVATTLIILFLMTGSVVLPIKAVIMNALGLSAMFGILVLIFQDGNLQGLLSYRSLGALDATQPILLFAVGFGLATDYGVFLLSRIKEARDAGASDHDAVAIGLERTGRVVTAAALLFAVALGAFSTSEIVFVKELGLGAVLAVLIDASIIRALLVPSLMDAARPAQLVGAPPAAAAARPDRAARGRAAGRRCEPVAGCFTSGNDGPGHDRAHPGDRVRPRRRPARLEPAVPVPRSCSTATTRRWSASWRRCARWSGTTPTTSACPPSGRARSSREPTPTRPS